MIGVVHRDPDGVARLLPLLRRLSPALITLEVSPYSVEYRQRHSEYLLRRLDEIVPPDQRDHGEMQSVREMLQMPYELRAAELYAAESGATVELVGDSDESRELLASVEFELLTPDNLAALLARPDFSPKESVRRLYERCRRLLASEPIPPALLGAGADWLSRAEAREAGVERRIRSALASRPHQCWAHIGGVLHLLRIRGARLLWERFSDLHVRRAFLDEL
jgi:hypothetical protein